LSLRTQQSAQIKRLERAIGELYLRINRLEKLQEASEKKSNEIE
jgi:hypothetical protein